MRQIVLQPDGRLAVYSTVVDDLVMYDATPDEVADEAADFVRETASPRATPEQVAERSRCARETAHRHAAYVLAGEPHRAYRHPLTWQEIEALTDSETHPRPF
ncbi:hypothetical protein [Streptomyces botrytidirepellens]|uniref:Uncharacterized protein n=1 Tax=Streptomyces botrytidirepellens TaxID=2486417 RepID=A0A3M8WV89_9ACTN|nr:hypothetical protein [Streptomyces botrytidirepellens]RNG32960.1 hypothetical protein EEJ42_07565 [Streptomyces botrytidirepellens]